MRRITRRDLLMAGVVLVLPGLVFVLMTEMFATRPPPVATDATDLAAAEAGRRKATIAANEAAVLEEVRKVIAAQAAYRAANHGFYEGRLDCLESPQQCIPFYPPNAPTFLDRRIVSLATDFKYRRSFTAGPGPAEVPDTASSTSVTAYRYDAWPQYGLVGNFGVRGFAADATGRICFTSDGTPVRPGPPGELDPGCSTLGPDDPKVPSDATTAPPTP